jgi:alcohol dehydrogenase
MKYIDYPSFDIEKVNETFLEWEHNKLKDILGYRNSFHRSIITGTMSPSHHTPWLLAMDDSLEEYLKSTGTIRTMKAHVYLGNGKTSWEDRPVPNLECPTDAIVRIQKTTICGTDLHILRGSVATCVPGRILGHEGIAVVEEVGSKVFRYKKGDQVLISCITSCGKCANCQRQFFAHCEAGGWLLGNTVDGCQAEYVRIPHADYSLLPFPEGVDEDSAVMLSDILPTGLEVAVLDGKLSEGQTLAIVGVGPVGLAALMSAILRKPKWIIAIDRDQNRLNVAKSIGATHCINNTDGSAARQIQELTNGRGVDLAVEAIGLPAGWDICENIVASAGNIAILGVHGKSVTLHLERMWYRNFSLTAGLVSINTIPVLVDAILSKQIDPKLLISHRIKLAEVKRGYEIFSNAAEHQCLKVILEA